MDPQDSLPIRAGRGLRHFARVFPFPLVVALALAQAAALGCGSQRTPADNDELRVVVNRWPGYSFLFLAEALGNFDDEELSVRLIELGSLADAAALR